MSEQFGQPSVVGKIEAESGDQTKLRVTQAIARTGAPDPEGTVSYLQQFPATGKLAENQRDFSAKIKAIKSDVHLGDDERLERGRAAAQEARDRHAELSRELERQADKRLDLLNKTLFSGSDSLTLNALADLDANQLDIRADLAKNTGDMDLLRAVRAVAATKGFDDLVTKAAALDEDTAISAAYQERQKLRTSGALQALSGAYAPPGITEQQLRPSSADVERARYAKASQDLSSKRVMSGRPGITDR